MLMKAVFDDGSYIVGERKWWYMNESSGTHHLKVTKAYGMIENGKNIDCFIVGHKIAIPIDKPKYWVLDIIA